MKVENLTIGYGKKTILSEMNWEFSKGQIIGLVAPNGRGKTTLFHGLMGKLQHTTGRLHIEEEVFDYPISDESRLKKLYGLMSMMVDQNHLIGHVSGMEHLQFYKKSWASSIELQEVVTLLGMESYIHNKVKTYSLGMRQRLCFAMQLVTDTKVMLMDEIMNGLDVDNVYLITNVMLELKKKGKVILIASHLLENLEEYADKVIFIKSKEDILIQENHRNQKMVTINVYSENVYPSLLNHYNVVKRRECSQLSLTSLNANDLYELANSPEVRNLRVGEKSLKEIYYEIYFNGEVDGDEK